jgi:hypothetical protein
MGDLEGADMDFGRSIQLEPQSSTAHLARGRLRLAVGAAGDALADLRHAVRLRSDSDSDDYAHLWIWLCRVKLGEERAATDELIAHVAARPGAKANDWYASVAGFLAGRVTEADLLQLAASAAPKKRDGQTCEACFYAASVRALRLDRAGALSLFDRCLATNATWYTEHQDAPAWKAGILVGARFRSSAPGGTSLVVGDVEPKGPAARAGLRRDDVIRVIDGRPSPGADWWRVLLAGKRDDVVRLEVVRGSALLEISLRLGRWD